MREIILPSVNFIEIKYKKKNRTETNYTEFKDINKDKEISIFHETLTKKGYRVHK